MSYGQGRRRRHGNDYIYSIEHLERFPEQYERIAHRTKLADVDWTEFCGYSRCHRPVMLVEMFRDTPRGLDLSDKGVTVTRYLANGVDVPAYVMAYLTERPKQVQDEIDRLNQRVLELTRSYPIVRYRAQLIHPERSRTQEYDPGDWWSLVVLAHSEHHQRCPDARQSRERLANPAWLEAQRRRHGTRKLWVPRQEALAGLGDAA